MSEASDLKGRFASGGWEAIGRTWDLMAVWRAICRLDALRQGAIYPATENMTIVQDALGAHHRLERASLPPQTPSLDDEGKVLLS